MKMGAKVNNCLTHVSRVAVVGITVWLIIFGLYAATAARWMTGFGDSDELITAGYTASLSHPPGYPLLTGMIFGFTHLPGFSPAVWAHLLAALIMSITVWMVYRILVDALLLPSMQDDWWNLVSVGWLALIVGASGLVWEHGTHIEVFGLNALFSLWFLRLSMKRSGRLWALVGGIGLSHHQTFVLVWLPLVILKVWSERKIGKEWLRQAGLAGVGFGIGYGLLWVFGNHITDYSWKFIPTLHGIWQFYTRFDYSGYSPELGQLSAWWSGISIHKTIEAWGFYIHEMWIHWNGFSLLGLGGILFAKKRLQRWYWPLVVGYLLAGPLLAGYLTLVSENPGSIDYETSRAIVERMYVLGDVWWGIWVGVGGVMALTILRRWRRLMMAIVGLLALVWIGWRIPTHNLSTYTAAELYAREMMGNLPPMTRLVCLSDISCFGTTYIQAVEGLRRDVSVISSASQYRSDYVMRQADLARFVYPDNPYRIAEIVGWSTYSGVPVVTTQLNAYWASELGLNGEAFRLTPLSYSLAIVRDAVGVVPAYKPIYAATQLLIVSPLKYRYVRVLRSVLTEHHALAAHLFRQMDNPDFAKQELTAGLLLDPLNQILLSMEQTIDSEPPDPTYREKLDDSTYEASIKACRENQDERCALWQSKWLTWRNPNQVLPRLELARSFEAARQLPFAKREYRHVLDLQPGNQEALTALTRLSTVIDLGDRLF